jgi:hypothetical protein
MTNNDYLQQSLTSENEIASDPVRRSCDLALETHTWPYSGDVPSGTWMGGYQYQDWEIYDYCLEKIPNSGIPFRGSLPSKEQFLKGDFIIFVGASQTFGRLVQAPFPFIVENRVGIKAFNMGRAGAAPRFFLDNTQLLDYAANAKCSVLQVLSARGVENSMLFPPNSNELFLASKTGEFSGKLYADIAWDHLLRKLPLPSLMDVVEETQERWFSEMNDLVAMLPKPVILLWFARRLPSYQISNSSLITLYGEFPHFVNSTLLARLKRRVDYYIECVTVPHEREFFSRFDAKKVNVHKDVINYYPDQHEHNIVAEHLISTLKNMVLGR